MKLAILILHFNTPELTDRLARSIPEAIVIDNGSDPGKEYRGRNNCLRLPKPLGFTKGWNMAINSYFGQYDAFWLMNSDIEISRDSIERANKVIARPDVDMFTPSYNAWNKSSHNQGTGDIRETGFMEFCAPVIKRSVFESVGMFDEEFSLGYGVELDFIYRAKQKGLKVHVDDGSCFYHLGHQTISATGTLLDYQIRGNEQRNKAMKKLYGKERPEKIYAIESLMNSDFNKKIFVYCEIFGDYDELKPIVKQNIPVPFVCVTDNPNLKGDGWKIIHVNFPRKDLHMNLQAKFFKMFPWEIPGFEDYEISIHIDAATQVIKDTFVEHALRNLENDMLLFKHPERDNIEREYKMSMTFPKYHYENTAAQVKHYLSKGFSGRPLYACTVLVRRHTDKVRDMMRQWYCECMQWSFQDQLSIPYVFWKNKFTPSTFRDNLWSNQYVNVNGHQHKGDRRPKEPGMKITHRNQVINHIIKTMDYKSYLEIGHETGVSFYGIEIPTKESIDIRITQGYKPTYLMTSDDFFNTYPDKRYDIIFIDGDHERSQVLRDVKNSLEAMNPGGCIVMHDTNPPNKQFTKKELCFTAYQAVVDIQFQKNDLEIYTLTIPEDQGNGISIIFKGAKTFKKPKTEHAKYLLFNFWDKHRGEITGAISFDGFDDVLKSKRPVKAKRKHSLTVLMPIYRTPANQLREAVESILKQSEPFDDFIIVDDGNIDVTVQKYLHELHKAPKIRIIRLRSNMGVAKALNTGLEACTTDLVLRMDADDMAEPTLIQRQHDFFEANPEAVICGVQIKCFGAANWKTKHPDPVTPQMIRDDAKYWLINHPGVCYKREIIASVGNYGNVSKGLPEDYFLWCKLARRGITLHNLPDVLMNYRYIYKPERQQQRWNDFREKCRKSIMI